MNANIFLVVYCKFLYLLQSVRYTWNWSCVNEDKIFFFL